MGDCLTLNYALNMEEYSLKNALTYGICKGHFDKAFYEKDAPLGDRCVHFLIVVAELVPLSAIFELVIVKGINSLCEERKSEPKKISAFAPQIRNISKSSYDRLLNKLEKENINYIVNMLATSYTMTLLWNKTKLLEAYQKLIHLHPLRVLTYIHDDKDLKQKVSLIKNRTSITLFGKTVSIWKSLMLGMAFKLTPYLSDREKFNKEYGEFARHLKLAPPKPLPNNILAEHKAMSERTALALSYILPIEDKF